MNATPTVPAWWDHFSNLVRSVVPPTRSPQEVDDRLLVIEGKLEKLVNVERARLASMGLLFATLNDYVVSPPSGTARLVSQISRQITRAIERGCIDSIVGFNQSVDALSVHAHRLEESEPALLAMAYTLRALIQPDREHWYKGLAGAMDALFTDLPDGCWVVIEVLLESMEIANEASACRCPVCQICGMGACAARPKPGADEEFETGLADPLQITPQTDQQDGKARGANESAGAE